MVTNTEKNIKRKTYKIKSEEVFKVASCRNNSKKKCMIKVRRD